MMETRPGIFETENFDFQFLRALAYEAYGGAVIGECLHVSHQIKERDLDSWKVEWTRLAERVEMNGREALANEKHRTAKEYFLRAYNYYRAAEFYVDPSNPEKRELWERSASCFQEATTLMEYPCEPLEIPYEDITLPGYLFRPSNDDIKRPTVILFGGGDGSGEELYFLGGAPEALARGYNVLLFEGPGHRGVLHRHPTHTFRHDSEAFFTPTIDFLIKQKGIDPDGVTLVGYSGGGYFTPRAAAFDDRIAALIPICPLPDLPKALVSFEMPASILFKHDTVTRFLSKFILDPGVTVAGRFDPSFEFLINHLKWTFGTSSVAGVLSELSKLRLDGLEQQITCPVLSIYSTGEGPITGSLVQEFAQNVSGPSTIRTFTAEEGGDAHGVVNNLPVSHQVMYDWLDNIFREN